MKIADLFPILTEAPLPDTWDKSRFVGDNFDDMVNYALENSTRIGKGSSRIAVKIPYKGRDTILKIQLNRKGVQQNSAEIGFLDDSYIARSGIAIPMIDHDTGSSPNWIHTEMALRANERSLQRAFDGFNIKDIIEYLVMILQPRKVSSAVGARISTRLNKTYGEGWEDRLNENENFQDLYDLAANFNGTLEWGDFIQSRNWGFYKGRPVVIDLGFSSEVKSDFYSGYVRSRTNDYRS